MKKTLVLADASGETRATLSDLAWASGSYKHRGPSETVISPDGQKNAVKLERTQTLTEAGISVRRMPEPTIFVIDRTGGRELAAFHRCWAAGWLPDGQLVMEVYDQPSLRVANVATSRNQTIPLPATAGTISSLSVSPDGSRIAFGGNRRIYLTRRDGSGLKPLMQSTLWEETLTWSPDGKFLAFQQGDPATSIGDYRIAVYRLADGKLTIVTDSQGNTREPSGRFYWHNR